ncbi:hypothetical protein NS183_13615 [Microbacterium testaceum]|nr:hypothetical protein NS183_13615 [Microbacterium testaceum]
MASFWRFAVGVALGMQVILFFAFAVSLGAAAWPFLLVVAVFSALLSFFARSSSFLVRSFVPTGMVVLAILAFGSTGNVDSPAVLAATWQCHFATVVAGLLLLDGKVVALVVAAGGVVGGYLVGERAQWGIALPFAIFVTEVSIIVALRLSLASLAAYSRGTDEIEETQERAASRAARREVVLRHLERDTRALHDTAINTLGAIADGSAERQSVAAVRAQCALDVTAISHLSKGRAPSPTVDLVDIFSLQSIRVERAGLDDGELTRICDDIDPASVEALAGCVREALNNVARHSGVDVAEVHVSATPEWVTVTVSDAGRGFDVAAARATQRGVERSILRRAHDHGLVAEVSSRLGAGSRVVVSARRERNPRSLVVLDVDEADRFVLSVRRRTALVWSGSVAVLTVSLFLAGASNASWTILPMSVVAALAWLGLRVAATDRPHRALALALLATTVFTFVLSAVCVDLGARGAAYWPALAVTGPVVLFLALLPGRRSVALIVMSLVATALVLCLIDTRVSTVADGNIVVAVSIAIVFTLVWYRFTVLLSRVAMEALRRRRDLFQHNLAADLEAEAAEHYLSWRRAGLDAATGLLDGISRGALDPRSPEVRARCGDEEDFLRQIIQIDPMLTHLGRAMIPTLSHARKRGVHYRLRLASGDVEGREVAERFADIVLLNLDACSRDELFSVSVFPTHQGLQLTMVGASAVLPTDAENAFTAVSRRAGLVEAVYVPGRTVGRREASAA